MSVNKMVDECLASLFEGYLENGGTPIFSLGEIITRHGYTPEEGGKVLVNGGLVKNHQFLGTDFIASISIHGINKISPQWMNDRIHKVMSTLYLTGGDWQGLMGILELQRKDYQIAFDISKELESLGYVEPQRKHDEIYVKLTPEGRGFCDDNKAYWV